MNTKTIVITAIVAILAMVLSMGCVEKDVPVVVVIDNTAFKNISANMAHDIAYQIEAIEAVKEEGDFVTTKIKLVAFDISLERYVTEFEEMKVAENTIPCKKAIIRFLEELQTLSVRIAAYIESPTVDAFMEYGMQLGNVTDQIEIVKSLSSNI